MVHTNRPITKFCCSDTPETEVRIIATFSIISTCGCLFFIFMAFANLQQHHHDHYLKQLAEIGNTPSYPSNTTIIPSCNDLSTIVSFNNETTETENTTTLLPDCDNNVTPVTTTTIVPPEKVTKNSNPKSSKPEKVKKKPSLSTLDWIMGLFLWDITVEIFWIILPFLWNFCDLLRALLLLHASTTKQPCLLKLWYTLTSTNVLIGLIIFYPIVTKYKAGDLMASFVAIYLCLLFYNCYSLWIVNLLVKEIQAPISNHIHRTWESNPSPSPDFRQDRHIERF